MSRHSCKLHSGIYTFTLTQTEINHNRFWNYDTSLSQGASDSDKKIVIALGQITSLICVAMGRHFAIYQ